MIACAIFVVAGIIAWQNNADEVSVDSDRNSFFTFIALVCWIMATLCAIGVVNE